MKRNFLISNSNKKMTNAQFRTALEACNWADDGAVSELVLSSHTNVMFNDKVWEKQQSTPHGAHNYFSQLFGTEVWPDGQGMDEIREYSVPNHMPFSFSYFVKMSEICDPSLADNCRTDYCRVPEGGRGTLPGIQFFKWGLQTERDCIANIRSISKFRYWAAKRIEDRERADNEVMNMFYVMAAMKLTGQKITMQGVRNADGQLYLVNSTDPRNPLRGGLYNYMQEKFPAPTDLDLILPITPSTMDGLARYWDQSPVGNEVARGRRGEPLYEFWYPDDWFMTNAIRDPDYVEKMKLTMPYNVFAGYSSAPGEREYIGNWAPRQMRWLPRFAPTNDGKIVPVDTTVGVPIEVGNENVMSQDFENAPFGLAMIVSGKQGTILSRPTLTTSGQGIPIMPIAGNGPWRFRNDYDKDCNPELNMPYAEKKYEMGMRMDNPTSAISFLFRRNKFHQRPVNECDLADIFYVEEPTVDCALTTVGCNTGKTRENNTIIDGGPQAVTCTAASCGNTGSSPYSYIIKVDRVVNQPGFNSLGCACGSAVTLYVYTEDDDDLPPDFVKEIQGIYKSDLGGLNHPYQKFLVQTTVALAAGECIRGISCGDETPLQGNVVDIEDVYEDGEIVSGDVWVILDSSITCKSGDDVLVRFYDSNGLVLGSHAAVIESYDPETFRYRLDSNVVGFKADMYTNQASVGVSCNESPNASSSSSGLP